MTLETTPILGSIYLPNGTAPAGYRLAVRLTGPGRDADLTLPEFVSFPIASDGSFSGDLWPSTAGLGGILYEAFIVDPRSGFPSKPIFQFSVPDAPGPLNIVDLIISDPPPPLSETQAILTQVTANAAQARSDAIQVAADRAVTQPASAAAVAAEVNAIAAAAAAGTSEVNAGTSETNAATSEANAAASAAAAGTSETNAAASETNAAASAAAAGTSETNAAASEAAAAAAASASVAVGFGVGQEWQTPASRTYDVSYFNPYSKSIAVFIRGASNNGSSARSISVSTDNATWVPVGMMPSTSGSRGAFFIVPPGHFYILSGSTSIVHWNEMVVI